MTMELSEPLRQALQAQPQQVLRLVDPQTKKSYVLVPAEVFDRMERELLEDQADRALQDGWQRLVYRGIAAALEEEP